MPKRRPLGAPELLAHAPGAIVMLTGYGDIPLAVAAVKEGADTLTTKPIDADRLLRERPALPERPVGEALMEQPVRVFNPDGSERHHPQGATSLARGQSAAKMLGIDRRTTLQRKLKKRAPATAAQSEILERTVPSVTLTTAVGEGDVDAAEVSAAAI
jgi:two-component system response regulator RegA